MLKLIPALPLIITLALTACSGDNKSTPTPTPQSTTAATQPVPTPTPNPATATASPSTDGTVAPENAGDTVPVAIKSNPDPISGIAVLNDVRVGAHPEQGGWDRIVFEFADALPPGEVRYVTSASQCGSGAPISVPGSAMLQVAFTSAQAHNDAGQLTIDATQIDGPGNVILKSVQTCDFEGHVTWLLGLKSQQRFKVTKLSDPTRVVIDIKQ